MPRIAYINKMDRTGADFYMSVRTIKERLGANAVPIQLPIGAEGEFAGIIDLVTMKATIYKDDMGQELEVVDIPADMQEQAEEYRAAMVEACADQDDEMMELYLEGEEISQERIMSALKAATLAITVTPVLCGSSFKNKGVQPLLDIIVALLPSPLDQQRPVPGRPPRRTPVLCAGCKRRRPRRYR